MGIRNIISASMLPRNMKKIATLIIVLAFVSAVTAVESTTPEKNNQGKCWEFAIPCQFEFAWGFQEGLARVRQNGKWGFIDKAGKIVIPCQFEDKLPFSFNKGLCRIKQNGKWGFIDKTGKVVIPCQFDSVHIFFSGDGIIVSPNGKFGIIDKAGKILVPCQFDVITTVKDELALNKNDSAPKISPILVTDGSHITCFTQ